MPKQQHLGGLLSDDGRICTELAARIGAATADFDKLSRIWGHSNIGQRRKRPRDCVGCAHVSYIKIHA